MEEMSVGPSVAAGAARTVASGAEAPRDLRDWIRRIEAIGQPGIKGVYAHPAAAGGFAMTVVSLEQRYPGHAPQVLALTAQVPGGAYFAKWIIAVDEDVD